MEQNIAPKTPDPVLVPEVSAPNHILKFKLMSGQEKTTELTDEEMRSQNVGFLKQKAFDFEINTERSTVRLIYQGKLLTDDKKLCDFNFSANPHIHAIITKVDLPSSNIESNSQAPSRNSEELRN